MGFGTPAGPPASSRQLRELLELVQAAGHADFRDARGPLGLTQRQAGGRFTRDEADQMIAELRAAAEDPDPAQPGDPAPASGAGDGKHPPTQARLPATRPRSRARDPLRDIPDEVLAAELQRRGWAVIQPG